VRSDIQIVFGEKLTKLREQRRWSQADLSERADIGIKHISSLENGHSEPCLSTLVKLAKAFNLKAATLIRGLD
jgi:transcriptional regulator with XRE-family HTH domain